MMGRIAGFVLRMLPVMAAAVPLVAAARLAGAYRLKNHGLTTTLRHEAGLWTFLLFLAGLAAVTILPPGGQFIPPSWSRVNLRPLVVLADSLAAMRAGDGMYFVINVLGNILMFLPLGFFPCLLWGEGKNGLLRGAGAALSASLCVEFCQLFQPRAADVDDLWLNALGGALGYGVYQAIRRLRPGWADGWQVRPSGE